MRCPTMICFTSHSRRDDFLSATTQKLPRIYHLFVPCCIARIRSMPSAHVHPRNRTLSFGKLSCDLSCDLIVLIASLSIISVFMIKYFRILGFDLRRKEYKIAARYVYLRNAQNKSFVTVIKSIYLQKSNFRILYAYILNKIN